MSLEKGIVKRSLLKKGFFTSDKKHKVFTYRTIKGDITTIKTHVSHGSKKDISDGIISQMAKQCKVDKQFFEEFARCHIDQAKFENQLKEQKSILNMMLKDLI